MRMLFAHLFWMRVWPSFLYLCKSSTSQLYIFDPLKLERIPLHSSAKIVKAASIGTGQISVENENGKQETVLKSIIRKGKDSEDGTKHKARRKKVQWPDSIGKDFEAIREIEEELKEIEDDRFRVCMTCLIQ